MTERDEISDAELLAWLDEDLPADRMSDIEQRLRQCEVTQQRVASLISSRDQGTVTVGEVWRRFHLSCPSRHELGTWLLQASEPAMADYIRFHLETVGCRTCQANVIDLQSSAAAVPETVERRQRIFASSVGRLKAEPR